MTDAYDIPVYDPPGPWRAQAACRGMDPALFHADHGAGSVEAVAAAKAVCDTCPSVQPCLVYALSNGEDIGVWGGLSPRQRRAARRMLGRMRVCPECEAIFHLPGLSGLAAPCCSDDCRRARHARHQAESTARKRRSEVA